MRSVSARNRRPRTFSLRRLGVCAAALLVASCSLPNFVAQAPSSRRSHRLQMQAAVVNQIHNPVKTVEQTVADFYQEYSVAPVLPMYRTFLIDFLTQLHLAVVDSRFKYDAVFALGIRQYFEGLMGSYDKLMGAPASDKIWSAMMKALSLDPEKVKADAEAAASYAGSNPPAKILEHMEGAEAPDARITEAFASIRSKLFSMPYSVGLFRMMELCRVEVSRTNAEEWAKALKIQPPSKVTSDLDTYRQNQVKLQKAEEMVREIEIREKKKLAERLEQKAKDLAAKAAAKAAEAAAAAAAPTA